MHLADIDTAMDLKNAEGWNQTREDWELFLHASPESCFVAVKEDQVVGTVVGVNYEQKVAWIGMMLVNRAFRGRGISKQLMTAVIASLGQRTCIKLDATPAGYPVYESLGFKEEYALQRMVADQISLPEAIEDQYLHVKPLRPEDLDEVAAYDQKAFGADRTLVLRHALRQQPEIACVYMEGSRLLGFLLGRTGTRYTHIGPLVADDSYIAKALLTYGCSQLRTGPLVLDVPVSGTAWMDWLKTCGFKKQRDLYRMFLNTNAHSGTPPRIFLIAGPELG
jgi:ribosomal protein S18 acetylase RimI-like enzyme